MRPPLWAVRVHQFLGASSEWPRAIWRPDEAMREGHEPARYQLDRASSVGAVSKAVHRDAWL